MEKQGCRRKEWQQKCNGRIGENEINQHET